MKTRCEDLSSPSSTNFAISLLILVGILISYLPQHIRIINRRSSFGLSPYFVLLGTTSGTCAFANILVLPLSRQDLACCREISGFACFAGILGIAQVGVQWSCFTIILLLFLIFFPRPTPATNPAKDNEWPSFRTALTVVAISVLHAMVTFILSLYFVLRRPNSLQGWANFLGILATVLSSIQYFPQIYTTYTLRRVGSLSIPMMCIQTPGSFLWSASLAARLGHAGWSTWGVYMVTGCFQGTLLGMAIYFELQARNAGKYERQDIDDQNTNGSAVGEDSEETPLLRPGG